VQRLIVAVEQRQVGWPGAAREEVRGQKSDVSGERVATTKSTRDTKGGEEETFSRRGAGAQSWEILTAEMKRFGVCDRADGRDYLRGAERVSR